MKQVLAQTEATFSHGSCVAINYACFQTTGAFKTETVNFGKRSKRRRDCDPLRCTSTCLRSDLILSQVLLLGPGKHCEFEGKSNACVPSVRGALKGRFRQQTPFHRPIHSSREEKTGKVAVSWNLRLSWSQWFILYCCYFSWTGPSMVLLGCFGHDQWD